MVSAREVKIEDSPFRGRRDKLLAIAHRKPTFEGVHRGEPGPPPPPRGLLPLCVELQCPHTWPSPLRPPQGLLFFAKVEARPSCSHTLLRKCFQCLGRRGAFACCAARRSCAGQWSDLPAPAAVGPQHVLGDPRRRPCRALAASTSPPRRPRPTPLRGEYRLAPAPGPAALGSQVQTGMPAAGQTSR